MRAAEQGAEPATVFWSGAGGRCRAAVVLAPARPIDAGTLLDLGLLALFDALAVLAPPQMPLVVRRPRDVVVDGGAAATVDAMQGSGWAVLGFEVLLRADDEVSRRADDEVSRRADDKVSRRADDKVSRRADDKVSRRADEARPGDRPGRTCLAEEGFGEVGAGELLSHVCRHLLGWVDAWLDAGAAPLSRAVDEREARRAAA